MISGTTILLPILGDPTERFKAPYLDNPWFAHESIDAAVTICLTPKCHSK